MRESRRREFLDAARQVVTTDGQAALTMLRLAKAVGTSEGNVYNYFSSKTVLLAELEIEALETIVHAFTEGQANIQGQLTSAKATPRLTALTRAMGSTRFWIAAESTLPNEIELSRRIYSQPETIESEQVERVLGAALNFLTLGAQTLEGAVERRVLQPGNNVERSLLALASISGALITGRLDQWDAGLFDGRHMATDLIGYLFAGWGAPAKLLTEAAAFLDGMTDEQLAPNPATT